MRFNVKDLTWTREPEDSSFKATFSEFKMTECMWKAHDGQKADAEE